MRQTLTILTALALTFSLACAASAAPCKDASGKFTKCPAAAPAAATGGYSLDARGNCHDATGKMAKKSMCPAAAPAAASPAMASSARSMTTASSDGPKCTKGKRCGNACISVKDVCHK